MNQIAGKLCAPVICQSRGPAFRWQTRDGAWHVGETVPPHLYDNLPHREQERIQRHQYRRMAMKNKANEGTA